MRRIGKLAILTLSLVGVSAFAVSDCAVELQLNGAKYDAKGVLDTAGSDKAKLWECPSLQNVSGDYQYSHKLKDIDFESGIYQCAYYYKDTGQYKQTCRFKSQLYAGMKRKGKKPS